MLGAHEIMTSTVGFVCFHAFVVKYVGPVPEAPWDLLEF